MFTKNFEAIKAKIEYSRAEAGLQDAVSLVAVVKYHTIEEANDAIKSGITEIAENKVQDLKAKSPYYLPSKRHLIGHLQTNKVRDAILLSDMIQSVDSIRLLLEIQKQSEILGKNTEILFELNIAGEESKTGAPPEYLNEMLDTAASLSHIRVRGLMAVMPIETKLLYYQRMYALFLDKKEFLGHNIDNRNISMDYLSMGMSGDYETAVKCGSNMVRLGRCLFD